MNFTVIVLSGIDRNLSIALSVSSAWNPPFIRLLGPPLKKILRYMYSQQNVATIKSSLLFNFVTLLQLVTNNTS